MRPEDLDAMVMRSLLHEGLLIRFSPEVLFGKNTNNHHFGVIVNTNNSNAMALIVGTTTNIQGAIKYASLRGLKSETVVVIGGGQHKHFGQQTAFNCNDPKMIAAKTLLQWYRSKSIIVPDKDPYVNKELLVELKNGVYLSDMVEDKLKRLLF